MDLKRERVLNYKHNVQSMSLTIILKNERVFPPNSQNFRFVCIFVFQKVLGKCVLNILLHLLLDLKIKMKLG